MKILQLSSFFSVFFFFFGYFVFFAFSFKFYILLFNFWKKAIWGFDRDCVSSIDQFWVLCLFQLFFSQHSLSCRLINYLNPLQCHDIGMKGDKLGHNKDNKNGCLGGMVRRVVRNICIQLNVPERWVSNICGILFSLWKRLSFPWS